MLPDALPQLIDSLLRLPLLEAAQLREVIQHLPDPQSSAEEMVRRGWITQDQFSSLFLGPQERPTPRETLLIGCGDDEVPPDANCDSWNLTVSDEDAEPDVPSNFESEPLERADEAMPPEPVTVETVSGAASPPQFEWDMLAAPSAIAAARLESDTDRRLRQWTDWAGKGLLIWMLFVGSFFTGRQLFGVQSPAPRVTRQQSKLAKKTTRSPADKRRAASPRIAKPAKIPNNQAARKDPAGKDDPAPPIAPIDNAKPRDELANGAGLTPQPAEPVSRPVILPGQDQQVPMPQVQRQQQVHRHQPHRQVTQKHQMQLVPGQRMRLVPALRY